MPRSATGLEAVMGHHSPWMRFSLDKAFERGTEKGKEWRARQDKTVDDYNFRIVVSSHGGKIFSPTTTEQAVVYFHKLGASGPHQAMYAWGPHGYVLHAPRQVQSRICRNDFNASEIYEYVDNTHFNPLFPYDYYLERDEDSFLNVDTGVYWAANGSAVYDEPSFRTGAVLCGVRSTVIFDIYRYAKRGIRFSDLYYIICAFMEGYCQEQYTYASLNVHMLFCRGSETPAYRVSEKRPTQGGTRSATRSGKSKPKTRRIPRRRSP